MGWEDTGRSGGQFPRFSDQLRVDGKDRQAGYLASGVFLTVHGLHLGKGDLNPEPADVMLMTRRLAVRLPGCGVGVSVFQKLVHRS